ncbi:proton-coupled folate transporter [Nematostella vectensis]|uniref:proton-coupled folate transporter n=1 Tax=Nematostella vectensis TaxID=45351 RepID=UPI002077104F|nr:proton-coupled folate transporter [Nematostella vectensis]
MPSQVTWRSFLSVEPVLLLYSYSFFMSMPLQRQYAYFRYSQATGFPYDLKEEKNMCRGGGEIRNATFVRLENEVQEHASQFDTSSVMCQALPALIMGLLIGPWTDSGGRKLALMVPVLGSILESLLTICVMHFSWPLYVIYAGKALNGLTGFFSALFQVSMSYIADISDPSQIAFRLAVMQFLIFGGGFISQLLSGVVLSKFGFVSPMKSVLLSSTIAFLYLTLAVPESLPESKRSKTPLFTTDCLRRVSDVFRKSHGGNHRNVLVLLAVDSVFAMITMGGNGAVAMFLMRDPLCFTPTFLGYFVASKFLVEGLGGVLLMAVFKRLFTEANVLRICMACSALSLVVLANTHSTVMIFTVVPLISALSGPLLPSVKGMMSKMVPTEEQGSLFTGVSAVETLARIFGAAVVNAIYVRSIDVGMPGIAFWACAVALLIPVALISFLQKPKEE